MVDGRWMVDGVVVDGVEMLLYSLVSRAKGVEKSSFKILHAGGVLMRPSLLTEDQQKKKSQITPQQN